MNAADADPASIETRSTAFSSFLVSTGRLATLDRQFPTYLSAWDTTPLQSDDASASHFGFVGHGTAVLTFQDFEVVLQQGMFFCAPGSFTVHPRDDGRGIVVSREHYRGQFSIGGPVEAKGRLRYIDGCTDGLLVPPVLKGDPCLNLLHFPAGVDQTVHDHPSDRVGMIVSGLGRCHYWVDGREHRVDLRAGMTFCIHTKGIHKFSTPYDQDMRVIAYHPDSDFGPTHEDHPMINRTIVEGVSAKYLDGIRTMAADEAAVDDVGA